MVAEGRGVWSKCLVYEYSVEGWFVDDEEAFRKDFFQIQLIYEYSLCEVDVVKCLF